MQTKKFMACVESSCFNISHCDHKSNAKLFTETISSLIFFQIYFNANLISIIIILGWYFKWIPLWEFSQICSQINNSRWYYRILINAKFSIWQNTRYDSKPITSLALVSRVINLAIKITKENFLCWGWEEENFHMFCLVYTHFNVLRERITLFCKHEVSLCWSGGSCAAPLKVY